MFSDFLIEDSGKPDEIAPDIVDHALEKLPVETLVYLLGSRYCETDRLSEFAWARLGTFPKGGALVQAFATSCIRRSRSAMSTRAWRGQPLTHSRKGEGCAATSPTSHHALPLHEHSCALLHRLSRGYRCAPGRPSDGFQRLVRGLSWRPLVHLRRSPQHTAHRPHPDRAWARRDRRRNRHLVRPPHAGGFNVVTDEVMPEEAVPYPSAGRIASNGGADPSKT